MNQIYRFDCISPPALSEKTLRAEIARRKLQHQTILLAVAGILIDWCLIILAVALYPVNIFLSVICIFHVCVAVFGGGAIAVVFTNKRRALE